MSVNKRGDTITISKDKVERVMVKRGITQSELAQIIGVTTGNITKLLRSRSCRMKTAIRLCAALQCNVEEIIEESEVRT